MSCSCQHEFRQKKRPGPLTPQKYQTEESYIQIPYYDSDRKTLLEFLSDVKCERFLATGVASAVRSKNGIIRRLYRLPRERTYLSAGYIHAAANRMTDRVQFEDGNKAAPWVLQHRRSQDKAPPVPVTEV